MAAQGATPAAQSGFFPLDKEGDGVHFIRFLLLTWRNWQTRASQKRMG
jgi:hypothetical protein